MGSLTEDILKSVSEYFFLSLYDNGWNLYEARKELCGDSIDRIIEKGPTTQLTIGYHHLILPQIPYPTDPVGMGQALDSIDEISFEKGVHFPYLVHNGFELSTLNLIVEPSGFVNFGDTHGEYQLPLGTYVEAIKSLPSIDCLVRDDYSR